MAQMELSAVFTGRSKIKTRLVWLLAVLIIVSGLLFLRDQECTTETVEPVNTEVLHEELADLSDYQKIADFVDRVGIDEIRRIIDQKKPVSPPKSPVKQKSVKPAFAEDPAFDWSKLGHFNKTKFLVDQIELCKKMNDRVKAYELQRQVPGLSVRDALLKYSRVLPTWELSEIKNLHSKVYFVGQGANKTHRLPGNTTNNFGFDHPKETKDVGRYRWVIGDQLNYRYEILKYLGGGTYGEVLQARDHKFDSLVAVKVLNNYTSIQKHIMTEYNIVERINKNYPNSPYFIRNIDNFKFRNHFCMVFELLGESAYDLYEEVAFRTEELALKHYVTEILKGLVLLHSIGIIHNDMKPDNLLLEPKKPEQSAEDLRMIKIMDFGLSCIRDTKTMSCPDYYIQTRYYRSPEVMLAIPYTTASDMWSFGVIVGEFFRGTEFIFGETEPDQMAAIMENIGLPPVSLIEKSDRRHIYYEAVCYVTKRGFHRRPYRKSITKTLQLSSPENDIFLDFLRRLLQWDPSLRLSADEALNHPWITGKDSDMDLLPPITGYGG